MLIHTLAFMHSQVFADKTDTIVKLRGIHIQKLGLKIVVLRFACSVLQARPPELLNFTEQSVFEPSQILIYIV